jgi:hypothetical protein
MKTIKSERLKSKYQVGQLDDEENDVLLREIQSIPLATRILSVDNENQEGFQLDNIVDAIDNRDGETEGENNSVNGANRKDSKESLFSDEEIRPFPDPFSPSVMNSVPFSFVPGAKNNNENNKSIPAISVTSVPSSEDISPVSPVKAPEQPKIEVETEERSPEQQLPPPPQEQAEERSPVQQLPPPAPEQADRVRSPSITRLIDQFNNSRANSTSDYTIPRIASISRITTVDSAENDRQARHLNVDQPSDQNEERFDEQTQVSGRASLNSPLKEANETPKPSVDIPSKYITVPRKGSNLYEDTVLDLTNRNLSLVRFSEFLSTNRFRALRVLILRNNRINNLSALQLFQLLPNVTDLDLAHNDLRSRISDVDLPRRIQRLDLSFNQLTDISGIMSCIELKELNVSNNYVKALYGLPVKLTRLDISHNRIHTVSSIRSLSICVALTSIAVAHNPVIQQLPNVKVFLRSVMPNLQEIDGSRIGLGLIIEKKKQNNALDSNASTTLSRQPSSPHLVSPLASPITPATVDSEEQMRQDSMRTKQQLAAKQKLISASKSVIDEFMSESAKSKKLNSDEVDSLTKRLYAPRGSPNDPRKYVAKTFQPAKKARRSIDPRDMQPDSNAIIDEWLGKASQQFDRIVKVFRIARSFIRMERINEKELGHFNALFKEIKTNRLVDINIKLKNCTDQKFRDNEKLNDIPKIRSDIEKSIVILQQIQTIILFCLEGAINFAEGMDLVMGSKAGQYVNENVLRLYNCYYEVNYSYQDFVTRQISSRSISQEGFNYDIRDEFIADNPMVFPDRRRSSLQAPGVPSSQSKEIHDPLDRVRSRVVNKFLPPDIKLDISLDNKDLLFAESNPMARLKKTPVKNSPAPEVVFSPTVELPKISAKEPVKEPAKESVKEKIARLNKEASPVKLKVEELSNNHEKLTIDTSAPMSSDKEQVRSSDVRTGDVFSSGTNDALESASLSKASTPAITAEMKTIISPSPAKSPKPSTSTTSPMMKSTGKSFRSSIDKLTQKMSTKDLKNVENTSSFLGEKETETKEQPQSATSTTEGPLSAKERLRRRMNANAIKPKSDSSISPVPSTDGDKIESWLDETVQKIASKDYSEDPNALVHQSSLKDVNVQPITVVSPQVSPKKSPGGKSPIAFGRTLKSSPSFHKTSSNDLHSEGGRTLKSSPSFHKTSSNDLHSEGGRTLKSSPSFHKTSSKDLNSEVDAALTPEKVKQSQHQPSALASVDSSADLSKLNAKERLRLRMEKNKKT